MIEVRVTLFLANYLIRFIQLVKANHRNGRLRLSSFYLFGVGFL